MAIESEHTLEQMLYMTMLDDQMAQLRHVEDWLDEQFRQVVHDMDEEALAHASERIDELVLTFPELRLPGLCWAGLSFDKALDVDRSDADVVRNAVRQGVGERRRRQGHRQRYGVQIGALEIDSRPHARRGPAGGHHQCIRPMEHREHAGRHYHDGYRRVTQSPEPPNEEKHHPIC